MPAFVCAFTGHRAAKLPWGYDEGDPRCQALKRRIFDAAESLYDVGVRRFLCGMALGCDLYFCETVLALRQERPSLLVEAVIPFAGQSDRWPAASRERYRQLCVQCDAQTVLAREYTADCMMRRNRYMVEHANILLACYNGQSGGTLNTMRYALSRGLHIVQLPVETQ